MLLGLLLVLLLESRQPPVLSNKEKRKEAEKKKKLTLRGWLSHVLICPFEGTVEKKETVQVTRCMVERHSTSSENICIPFPSNATGKSKVKEVTYEYVK